MTYSILRVKALWQNFVGQGPSIGQALWIHKWMAAWIQKLIWNQPPPPIRRSQTLPIKQCYVSEYVGTMCCFEGAIQFDPKDMYNMVESRLLFKMQPNKTLWDQGMARQKKCKEHIVVGMCANMDGNLKLPLIVINKPKNPHPFSCKKIKWLNNLGIYWYANKKILMTRPMFINWLHRFEKIMVALGKKLPSSWKVHQGTLLPLYLTSWRLRSSS